QIIFGFGNIHAPATSRRTSRFDADNMGNPAFPCGQSEPMGFGPSQTDYRKFRGHHLHSMAQVTHCFNQVSLAGIYDDNIVRFDKCPNH
ncbi:hypothetical protein LK486_17540, partial [Fusicatenibacter saccharivorans]|nr:hypothetical protein [Fusicatenibacter saccharivorans]